MIAGSKTPESALSPQHSALRLMLEHGSIGGAGESIHCHKTTLVQKGDGLIGSVILACVVALGIAIFLAGFSH